jgi:4-hydroxybenzoate polyprenyltransferase
MSNISSIKSIANNLSLNITLSCGFCAFLFSKYLYVDLPWVHYAILAISVWLIYTYDHLSDTMEMDYSDTNRYQFHIKYRDIIKILFWLAMATGAGLLIFLPIKTIYAGLVLSAFIVLYFILLGKNGHVKKYKEFFAAGAVTAGIGGVITLSLIPSFYWISIPMLLAFFIICLQNLALFTYFDREQDKKLGFATWITKLEEAKFNNFMMALFLIGFMSNAALLFFGIHTLMLFVVLCAMELVLLVIFLQKDKFAEKENYRFWGDFIFFFPALLLLV